MVINEMQLKMLTYSSLVMFYFASFLVQIPHTAVTSIIDGLKKLYNEKLKPLEATYLFNDFVSPSLVSRLGNFLST